MKTTDTTNQPPDPGTAGSPAVPGSAELATPSRADCESRLRSYMEKHGHEGTASREEKEAKFRRAYWDFERRGGVPQSKDYATDSP